MQDLARLIVRLTFGGLLAGHGAQKLFGWFEGPGIEGTSGMMGSLGLHPRRQWALLAGASEFGGGLLTALGFLNPIGPAATLGAMSMATAKVHWGKPIWVTKGGAELPLINMAVASALMLVGPGRLSLDGLLGTRQPRSTLVPIVALAIMGTYVGLRTSAQQQPSAPREQSGAELQAGPRETTRSATA